MAWIRVFDKQLEMPSRPLSAPAASVMERWSTREGYDERTAPPAAACLRVYIARPERKKRKEKKLDAHEVIVRDSNPQKEKKRKRKEKGCT